MIKGMCHFTVKGAAQGGLYQEADSATTGTADSAIAETSRHSGSMPTASTQLQPTDLLKTLVLYMQYMLIIASLNLEWPASISYPFQALAWIFSSASPESFSVDCLFSRDGHLPIAIKKTLFYLAVPVIMLAALLLYEVVAHHLPTRDRLLRRHSGDPPQHHLFDKLLSYAVVALFFFLPSVARTTFSLFACVLLDDPSAAAMGPQKDVHDVYAAVGRFWMLDMNQQCYQGYHKAWSLALGLPLLVLLCIVLPAAVLGLTLHGRKRAQQDPQYICHYSFLLEPYKPRFCFWEGIMALQTQGLVAISVFGFTLGPYYQTLVMHTAIATVLLLLIVLKPYAKAHAGIIMQQCVLCLLVTSLAALSFMPNGPIQPTPIYALTMGALLVVLNIIFIVSVIVKLIMILDWQSYWAGTLRIAARAKCLVIRAASKTRGCMAACKAVSKEVLEQCGGYDKYGKDTTHASV